MTTHRIERTGDVLAEGTLFSGRPKLVLSPHLDDALLSAFAVMTHGSCEVWTVFAGRPAPPQTTTWDLSCGFRDSDETMAARHAEDQAALRGLPVQTRRMEALDGAYTTPARRQQDLAALRSELERWLSEHPDGVIIAPVGAGLHVPAAWWQRAKERLVSAGPTAHADDTEAPNHPEPAPTSARDTEPIREPDTVLTGERTGLQGRLQETAHLTKSMVQRAMHADAQRRRRKVLGTDGLAANPDHLDVRNLALDVALKHSGSDVVLFEDLPYLWHEGGAAEANRLSTARKLTLQRRILPVDRQAKNAHLAHYVSQMPVMDSPGRLMQAETLPENESYWLISR